MNKLLKLEHINAGYDHQTIIKDINLEVFKNDFIGIIGPNGGGKTTLLKVILGLIKPFSGTMEYYFPGEYKNTKTFIGYLPQQVSFDKKFPISVSDVILSGLISSGRKSAKTKAEIKHILDDILEKLGMKAYCNSSIGELSGGQVQRVFLGRAIISNPALLILDEPNSFVDNRFEHELYEILMKLNETMAILLVSHDIGTISSYIKTIACVNQSLHYHPSNTISSDQLKVYNCPIDIITHGKVPHRVLHEHK
ncbi:MAG: ATP-binding cassette domain-containing protein [Bacteroidales bacterium]|nr:ATP-binding cassette domain-containing protein [Bacteroidales bacterium]MCF8389132.1 ATP-binding cassette domain-containing protein [Bacteroidales bacterium]